MTRAATLAAALALAACGDDSLALDASGADTDTAWAPWPPEDGDAGLSFTWTVDALAPTAESCAGVDLDRLELVLVHPVADFETWTIPALAAECPVGEIRLESAAGLAPGRYRFFVRLLHPGGDEFQQSPERKSTRLNSSHYS